MKRDNNIRSKYILNLYILYNIQQFDVIISLTPYIMQTINVYTDNKTWYTV